MKRIGRFLWAVIKTGGEGILTFIFGMSALGLLLAVIVGLGFAGGWVVSQFIECKDSTESVSLFMLFATMGTVVGLVLYSIYMFGRWLVLLWKGSK